MAWGAESVNARWWIKISKFFVMPGNQLLQRHGKDGQRTWLWKLLDTTSSTDCVMENIQELREVFDNDPSLMVQQLQRFGDDVHTLESGLVLMQDNPEIFTFMVTRLQSHLKEGFPRSSPPAKSGGGGGSGGGGTDPKTVSEERQRLVATLRDKYLATVTFDEQSEYLGTANAFRDSISQYRREEALLNPERNVDDNPAQTIIHAVYKEARATFSVQAMGFLSDAERCNEKEMKGFHRFVTNVETLAAVITGTPVSVLQERAAAKAAVKIAAKADDDAAAGIKWMERFQVALEELRRHGATRVQQFVPIHEELKKLRHTVEQQQQIITSLEFRYVLEHLPDKARYPGSSTTSWRDMWEAAVKQQITQMKTAKAAKAASTSTASAAAPSVLAHPGITHAMQFEFDKWWGKKGRQPWEWPDYQKWDVFRQGQVLYGVLSNNIHDYAGVQYEIHSTNWPKAYANILDFLRPTHFTGDGDVDWDAERKIRGV